MDTEVIMAMDHILDMDFMDIMAMVNHTQVNKSLHLGNQSYNLCVMILYILVNNGYFTDNTV
jgi:hypothetical protein